MPMHQEHEQPTERFWYVHKTRVVYEYESFWDTEAEARADALKHPGAKVDAPDAQWLKFLEEKAGKA